MKTAWWVGGVGQYLSCTMLSAHLAFLRIWHLIFDQPTPKVSTYKQHFITSVSIKYGSIIP
jgi:hypothetical protein